MNIHRTEGGQLPEPYNARLSLKNKPRGIHVALPYQGERFQSFKDTDLHTVGVISTDVQVYDATHHQFSTYTSNEHTRLGRYVRDMEYCSIYRHQVYSASLPLPIQDSIFELNNMLHCQKHQDLSVDDLYAIFQSIPLFTLEPNFQRGLHQMCDGNPYIVTMELLCLGILRIREGAKRTTPFLRSYWILLHTVCTGSRVIRVTPSSISQQVTNILNTYDVNRFLLVASPLPSYVHFTFIALSKVFNKYGINRRQQGEHPISEILACCSPFFITPEVYRRLSQEITNEQTLRSEILLRGYYNAHHGILAVYFFDELWNVITMIGRIPHYTNSDLKAHKRIIHPSVHFRY